MDVYDELIRLRKLGQKCAIATIVQVRGSIPSWVIITDGKVHDVNLLDQLVFEAGAFYIFDRGYLDFARLHGRGRFFAEPESRKNRNDLIVLRVDGFTAGLGGHRAVWAGMGSNMHWLTFAWLRDLRWLTFTRLDNLRLLTFTRWAGPAGIA